LPLLIEDIPGEADLFGLPADAVLEVPLTHPDHRWFAGLGLRWNAGEHWACGARPRPAFSRCTAICR